MVMLMKNDLVSVIVPVYDVEFYLERCLHSILNQTYTNIEVLLVDDGSSDDSGKICDMFSEIDGRVNVIHKGNEGQSSARNVALDICKGQYITFVDSDDWIEIDYVEKLIAYANPNTIVCCGYNVIYDGVVLSNKVSKHNKYSVKEFMDLLLTFEINKANGNSLNPIGCYMWNKIWPRDCFENIRFPRCKYEDIYIFVELISCVDNVVLIPESKYNYLQRKESTIYSDNFIDFINSRLKQESDLVCSKNLENKAKILTACASTGCIDSASVNYTEYYIYKKIIADRMNKDMLKYKFILIKIVMFLYFTKFYVLIKKMRRILYV